MEQRKILENTIQKLLDNFQRNKVLIGFDGFIDEIIDVVKERVNPTKYEKVTAISEFSENIKKMAALSGNIELVPTKLKFGGKQKHIYIYI